MNLKSEKSINQYNQRRRSQNPQCAAPDIKNRNNELFETRKSPNLKSPNVYNSPTNNHMLTNYFEKVESMNQQEEVASGESKNVFDLLM